jgi:hypothetical protein
MKCSVLSGLSRKAINVAMATGLAIVSVGASMVVPTTAEAQYYYPPDRGPGPRYGGDGYRRARSLVCVVDPEYRRNRSSCAVGGYGKAPGDYCECRLYNHGPTVPGTIVGR